MRDYLSLKAKSIFFVVQIMELMMEIGVKYGPSEYTSLLPTQHHSNVHTTSFQRYERFIDVETTFRAYRASQISKFSCCGESEK